MSAADTSVMVRPPLLYAAALGIALALRWWRPLPIGTPTATLWSGIAFLGLGLGFIVWGRTTLLAAGTAIDRNGRRQCSSHVVHFAFPETHCTWHSLGSSLA